MRITSNAGADQHALYTRYFEYARIISTVHLTTDGAYKENELPPEYVGAALEIEVVHAVYMVNAAAELVLFEFETPEAMDKDKKKGGPIKRDGEELRPKTGESEVPTEQVTVLNESLDDNRKQVGAMAMAQFKADLEENSEEPKS